MIEQHTEPEKSGKPAMGCDGSSICSDEDQLQCIHTASPKLCSLESEHIAERQVPTLSLELCDSRLLDKNAVRLFTYRRSPGKASRRCSALTTPVCL
jgi:hypothetical protein